MNLKRGMLGTLVVTMLCGQLWRPVCAEEAQSETITEQTQLYAKSAVLLDGDTGRVLFGKEESYIQPMASTTKIMTCILALEEGGMEEVMYVSPHAAGQPKVRMGVRTEDTFYLKDLLYSLMLESHNDSAVVIAEHMAGSVERFADRMNEKAKELNCQDTYFVTPNGLDGFDEGGTHSTTAKDLALLMKYCINDSPKKEEFLALTRTKTYSFSNVEGTRSFSCNNRNAFLDMMEGALSGKTGFTGDAGYCYVGALRRGEKTFIVALLACGWPNNKGYKWKDTRALFEYGLKYYEQRQIWKEEALYPIVIEQGIEKKQPFQSQVKVAVAVKDPETKWTMLLRKDEAVTVKTKIKDKWQAPIKQGDAVGTITYFLEGKPLREFTVVTTESVKRRDISWCFRITLQKWLTGNRQAI